MAFITGYDMSLWVDAGVGVLHVEKIVLKNTTDYITSMPLPLLDDVNSKTNVCLQIYP